MLFVIIRNIIVLNIQVNDIVSAKAEYQQGIDLLLRYRIIEPTDVAENIEFKLLLIALLGNIAAAILKEATPDYHLIIQFSNEVNTNYRCCHIRN